MSGVREALPSVFRLIQCDRKPRRWGREPVFQTRKLRPTCDLASAGLFKKARRLKQVLSGKLQTWEEAVTLGQRVGIPWWLGLCFLCTVRVEN